MDKKPKYLDEYRWWLDKRFHLKIDRRTQEHYNHITPKLKTDIENSLIWADVFKNWKNFNDEFLQQKRFNLFVDVENPPFIEIKPYESFLDKTYRKNVLHNPNWPNEPSRGWILPNNWYSSIDDIIRTTIVVKYLDGVEFITDKIEKLCKSNHIDFIPPDWKASVEGYYAVHIYTKQTLEIPDLKWKPITREVLFEIQITTQLQEVIKKLLHKYYEKKRISDISDSSAVKKNWQWDYSCDEFATNYLGHILHYIEGMIMDIRKKQE